jgi:hypothetical protein
VRLDETHQNLIVDSGLDALGIDVIHLWCGVGGGTTLPAVTDTALENQYALVYRTGTNFTILPEIDGYPAAFTVYYDFPAGSLTGQQINEVGIFNSDTNSVLWSRFVLPDPVTLLADESLQINYTLYSYVDLADQISTVSYDGVDYSVTVRPASIDDSQHRGYNGEYWAALFRDYLGGEDAPGVSETDVLPAITAPDIVGTNANSFLRDEYVPGSRELTGWALWDQDAANFDTGWGLITLNTSIGTWHMRWSPKIPKDLTKSVRVFFKLTWGRV